MRAPSLLNHPGETKQMELLHAFLQVRRELVSTLPRDGEACAYLMEEGRMFHSPTFDKHTRDTVYRAYDPSNVFVRGMVSQMKEVEGTDKVVVGVIKDGVPYTQILRASGKKTIKMEE